jgi:hypothetical protein
MDHIINLISDDEYDSDVIDRSTTDSGSEPTIPPASPPDADPRSMGMMDALPRNNGAPAAGQPPAPNTPNVWGDYILDEAFDDEAIMRIVMEMDQQPDTPSVAPENLPPVPQPYPAPPVQDMNENPQSPVETRDDCIATVMVIFPDICGDYVSDLLDKVSHSSDQLIAYILDKTEKGTPYPKSKDKQKSLKRKREVDPDEAAVLKYGAADRAAPPAYGSARTIM